MDNEVKNLQAAFIKKEQVQAYLSDLERLNAHGSLNLEQYEIAKARYQQELMAAVSEIANIKNRLKLQLQTAEQNLSTARVQLEELEIRREVGELTPEQYYNSKQKAIKIASETSNTVDELRRLITAKSSAQLDVLAKGIEVGLPHGNIPVSKISREGILSPFGIVGFVIAGLMLITFFFIPAISVLGVSISFMQINPGIGIVCLLAAFAFAGAVFVEGRTTRGKAHLGIGIVALLVQLVVLYMVMHDAGEHGYSGFEFLYMGFWLYVLAAIAGIVVGVLESRGH